MSRDPLKMPARLPHWNAHKTTRPEWFCAPLDLVYRLDCTSSGVVVTQCSPERSDEDHDFVLGLEILRTAEAETIGRAVLIASIWHAEEIERCDLGEHTTHAPISEKDVELV